MFRRKPKVLTPEQMEEIRIKDFFDMILPGNIKFFFDHYIIGDSYHSVWVIRESGKTIICLDSESEYEELADRGILHSGAASWKAWTHGKRPALYAVIFLRWMTYRSTMCLAGTIPISVKSITGKGAGANA